MESMKADWSLLDPDLLSLVLNKLPLHRDYLHFSIICKSWHDVSKRQMDERVQSQAQNIPLLLVPTRDGCKQEHGLYDLVNNKALNFQVSLPRHFRCVGSSHGWLLYNSKTCFTMLNPFTGGKPIRLPRVKLGMAEVLLEDFEREFFYPFHVIKAVLSCDPSLYPNDYEVLVVYGIMCDVAIFRAGDKDWTPVINHPNIGVFNDVIYHKGAFYVIDNGMGVGRITLKTFARRKTQSTKEKDCVVNEETVEDDKILRSYDIDMVTPRLLAESNAKIHFPYLVESSNNYLVCALRVIDKKEGVEDSPQCVTSSFRVFRLVNGVAPKWKRWVEIDALGGDALFVGDNHSTAVNVNRILGYKKNSIYYTDDWNTFVISRPYGPGDVGFFCLENQSLQYLYKFDASHRDMPPAIWIVPSLQGYNKH